MDNRESRRWPFKGELMMHNVRQLVAASGLILMSCAAGLADVSVTTIHACSAYPNELLPWFGVLLAKSFGLRDHRAASQQ
jgi:hypothetical protein